MFFARLDKGKLAHAVCPGIVHSQVRYKYLLQNILQPGSRWLDLGCGHETIRAWALLPGEEAISFTRRPALAVGIDSDAPSLRENRSIPYLVAGDIKTLPFADCSFDVITANMVLEHTDKPALLLSEVWRVLRPKGVFVFHTPNKYYPASLVSALLPESLKSRMVTLATNRQEKDVYPTFYRLNTLSAITEYCEPAGFKVKYAVRIETLTFSPHTLLFLFQLAVAGALRFRLLDSLRPDLLVMLCKPARNCACQRLSPART